MEGLPRALCRWFITGYVNPTDLHLWVGLYGASRWWRDTIAAHAAPYWRTPGRLYLHIKNRPMGVDIKDLERFLARRQTTTALILELAIYARGWEDNERALKDNLPVLEHTLDSHGPFIAALTERIRCQERDLALEHKLGAGRLQRACYTAEDNRAWSAAQLEATRAELRKVQSAPSYVEASAAVKRITWRQKTLLRTFAMVLRHDAQWTAFYALCEMERAQIKHAEELERKRRRNQRQEVIISQALARLNVWRAEMLLLETDHAERAVKIARLKEELE